MKFIINSQVFSKQIQALSGVLTTNNTVPIINCFHLHLDENQLTIKATDLETTLISTIEVETGKIEGLTDVAIPSKLLINILKSFDNIPLSISVDDNTFAIEISSGEGKYRLAGLSAETYPSLPEVNDTVKVSLPSSALVEAINKTSFAASSDEMRPQMCGIFCEITPDCTTFVATDAHKLVRFRRTDIKADESTNFILPKKPLSLVKNTLSSYKEDIEVLLEYNAANVAFTFDNMYIVCRLVDGKYPNYDAAIPKENPNRLTVDRLSMLNTLRRVGLFANQSTYQVRLSITNRELTISAEDIEFSNDAVEKIPCEYDGEPMEIGFNAKFLTEMVSNLNSENILIEMSHPSRAGIIFPINDNPDGTKDDILMLVMPVMLANN